MEEERQRLDGEGDSIRELTRRVWKGKYFFCCLGEGESDWKTLQVCFSLITHNSLRMQFLTIGRIKWFLFRKRASHVLFLFLK